MANADDQTYQAQNGLSAKASETPQECEILPELSLFKDIVNLRDPFSSDFARLISHRGHNRLILARKDALVA